jgi:hypothetical protein
MKDLKELVFVLENNGLNASSVFGGVSNPSTTKLWSFYQGILSNKWENDDDASKDLYPLQEKGTGFRKLKSDFKERLQDAILSLKFTEGKYNSYQKAYYRGYRDLALFKILAGQNANDAAATVASRLLRHAQEFEFTFMALEAAGFLRMHFGARLGDMVRFQENNQLHQTLQNAYHWESMAEEYYIILTSGYVNTRSTKTEINEKAQAFFQDLKPALQQFNNYRLHFYGALIQLAVHTTVNDYLGALKVCQHFIAFFKNKPYEAHVPLQILHYQELLCYVQLKDFDAGQAAAEACKGYLSEGSYNWFKYQELMFLLSMHSKRYQEGYQIYHLAVKHPRFGALPSNVSEIWRIFGAYLAYLISLGKITPTHKDGLKNFRVARFLNDTPVYSKDKRGLNVAILIVQTLLLLSERKKSALIDRVESLEQYAYKYLKNDYTLRSHFFLKILIQLPLCAFERKHFLTKTQKNWEKLTQARTELSNQTHEIEIIPFEDLWEMLLSQLE